MREINQVSVFGLGSMGLGVATSLLRAGFDVIGSDLDQAACARFAEVGGRTARTPTEAGNADAIVSVVVNADQTEQVLLGDEGALASSAPDAIVISCATMAPDRARSLARRVEQTGRAYIDAPISGGSVRAASGELTVLCSGQTSVVQRARPVIDAMSSKLFELGQEAGIASAFKAVNQLLAGIHIAAASEAMAFAAALDLDLRKVYEVITSSAGNSWMFENRVPHILDADYTPRSTVDIFVKDLGIVEDIARAGRIPVPLSAAALQLYVMTSAAGMGRDDDASVARLYAKIARIDLPRADGTQQ